MKGAGDGNSFRRLHRRPGCPRLRGLESIRAGFGRLGGGTINIGAQSVARNAGQPFEVKDTGGWNLLPRIEGLMPDAQTFSEPSKPTNFFRTVFYEVDHGR